MIVWEEGKCSDGLNVIIQLAVSNQGRNTYNLIILNQRMEIQRKWFKPMNKMDEKCKKQSSIFQNAWQMVNIIILELNQRHVDLPGIFPGKTSLVNVQKCGTKDRRDMDINGFN